VRELSNVVERLAILCNQGRVGQLQLRESMSVPASVPLPPQTAEELNVLKKRLRTEAVAEAEKSFLLDALRRNDYNVTLAAEQTGMQRSNLQALLKKHGLRIKDLMRDR
jgi:DNA-binding NtrC family response regulator